MDLDDVLSDKVEEAPKVDAEVTTEVTAPKQDAVRQAHQRKEWEAQGRDPETGQYIPKQAETKEKEQKVDAPPKVEQKKEEFTDRERAFLKATEEERRKRQALEAELAQHRQKKEPEGEKKTFWDDPEGHLKGFEQRLAQREQSLTLQVSERIARSKYQDFDEKIGEFGESLRNTPGLHAQWLASPDPAEFAYKHGQRVKEMREVGDLDKYREKIEKETRAKLEAEFKAKHEELEKKRAALPGSLSDIRGTSTQQRPTYNGPTSLDDILGSK